MSDVDARLAALEEAVARLAARDDATPAPPSARPSSSPDVERFWLLETLREHYPGGAVAFGGHVDLVDGSAQWQIGRLTDDLLDAEVTDWSAAAPALSALGHPVRLHLLRLVLTGTTTTAALAETEGLGTTGQLHHHLRTLVAAGWLSSVGRGQYRVPTERVIPLLVLVSATA